MGYIQVEGINIGAAIFDTNQLSVMRGGSLLLKQAVESLPETFKELTPISTGASSGIYEAAPSDTLAGLADRIAIRLSTHPRYRHLTFAVAGTEEDDFIKAKEILLAKVRLLQLRQLAAAPDPEADNLALSRKACELEGIRRAHRKPERPPKGYSGELSEACIARFEYGRENRSGLYKTELGWKDELSISDDFSHIACGANFGNLDDKLAIIYFDGNGFGKIQRSLVADAASQRQFDTAIKNFRRGFLKTLLERWREHPESKPHIRLETLLWGGDEMMFVVPAWRGFELARLFYAESSKWTTGLSAPNPTHFLHAGGMVFCHYKAPISRMTQLAKDLADDVKDYKNGAGRQGNAFNYTILESIDYPAEPLRLFFGRRFGAIGLARSPLRPVQTLATEAELAELRAILRELPRSQIHELARLAAVFRYSAERGAVALAAAGSDEAIDPAVLKFIAQTERLQKLYPAQDSPFQRLPPLLRKIAGLPCYSACFSPCPTETEPGCQAQCAISPEPAKAFGLLAELLGDAGQTGIANLAPQDINQDGLTHAAWRWLHLAELWDYLAPESQAEQGDKP